MHICVFIKLFFVFFLFRRFNPGKEHFSAADFDRSWIGSERESECIDDKIDRILRGNQVIKDCSLMTDQQKSASEVVGRQETWLIVYCGVEGDNVKSDLHIVVCTKELRCVPSSSGSLSIAAETLSDWKFESLTPRTSGLRSSYRYNTVDLF